MSRILLFSIVLLSGCIQDTGLSHLPAYQLPSYTLPYHLATPGKVISLNSALVEVSGLCLDTSSSSILTVNDEMGVVYILDNQTGKINRELNHSKPDDYEGVALVGNHIYAVESNGNLKVIDYNSGKKIKEIRTLLSRHNDIEGLCYDSNNGRLLLAAKGDSGIGHNHKKNKAIFAYYIAKDSMAREPAFTIPTDAHFSTLEARSMDSDLLSKTVFDRRIKDFAPSGIAIHPKTGNIYVISARGAVLVVLDKKGTILSYTLLLHRKHRQAEGISFAENGDMYISDEGGLDNGRITVYPMVVP